MRRKTKSRRNFWVPRGRRERMWSCPESSWVILPFWFPVSYDDQTYGIVLTKNEEHTRKSARKRKA